MVTGHQATTRVKGPDAPIKTTTIQPGKHGLKRAAGTALARAEQAERASRAALKAVS